MTKSNAIKLGTLDKEQYQEIKSLIEKLGCHFTVQTGWGKWIEDYVFEVDDVTKLSDMDNL